MSYRILAINPGSTSTKIAIYENETEVFCKTLNHPAEEMEKYTKVADQFQMRKEVIFSFLQENGFDVHDLSAVVGRGGMLKSVKTGAYLVNEQMVEELRTNPYMEHASNLGALIAYEIANMAGVPAYIYDSVRSDELTDIARISGMPDISRTSTSHVLNSRATAMKVAEEYQQKYQDLNFIVAHLGGGISLSVHEKGRIIDIVSDDEGPFSPESAGRVPCRQLIQLSYSGQYDLRTMMKKQRGNSGLKGYLQTVDAREVENMIDSGNEYAKLIYEAMAYQVAKSIGELSTVLKGNVDAIVITGGIAYSGLITSWIKERVDFIGPVEIVPGENEMEALTLGALRVLKGEEEAARYMEIDKELVSV